MQIKKIIAIFFFVASLMTLNTVQVNGQTQQNNKVVSKKGWELQKIEDLETKEENQIKIDGIAVVEKRFQIGDNEPSINLKKDLNCIFRNLSSYSINGKTFAYEGYCVPLSTSNNLREYAGAIIRFLVFDEDGDGKFESRYSSLDMKIFVPDYLKQK